MLHSQRLKLLAAAVFLLLPIRLDETTQVQAAQRPAIDRPVAINNVTIVDATNGQQRPGSTVIVQQGRITAVGNRVSVPGGSLRIDGTGKFLIPGLWDMHSHNQGTGVELLDLYLAYGVVGTRDMGSDADFILPLRDRIRRGDLRGPEIVAAGPILDDAPADWPFRRRVTNAEDAREAVRDLAKRGVDFIKVHNNTPREAFFAIANETKRLGLPFAGHIPLKVTVEECIKSGMSSVEHLSESRLFQECPGTGPYTRARCQPLFDEIAARHVWQTPTGAFYQAIPDVFSGQPIPHAEFATASMLEMNRKNVEGSKLSEKVLAIVRTQNETRKVATRDLLASGAQLLAGCDGWVPGICLHDELQWLTEAGLSPLQALQTATINPAKFLGRQDSQGVIQTGRRADLVLLTGDPLADIRNTRRISAVILGGHVFAASDLERMITARKH